MASIMMEVRDNKPVWIWRLTLLVLIGFSGFMLKWAFAEINEVPKIYPTKVEQQAIDTRQDTEIRTLRHEITEGFRETQRIILDLHK